MRDVPSYQCSPTRPGARSAPGSSRAPPPRRVFRPVRAQTFATPARRSPPRSARTPSSAGAALKTTPPADTCPRIDAHAKPARRALVRRAVFHLAFATPAGSPGPAEELARPRKRSQRRARFVRLLSPTKSVSRPRGKRLSVADHLAFGLPRRACGACVQISIEPCGALRPKAASTRSTTSCRASRAVK